jgi:hypothetical protein
MEADFDFIETVSQKKKPIQTQQINLLELDSPHTQTATTKEPTTLNLLEDLNFQPSAPKEDSPFDLSQSLKPETEKMSPVRIAMEAEYNKKNKSPPKESNIMDDFDDFKAADQPAKKAEKAKEKDIWGQFEDILDIGNLSEPKKAEPKSIFIIRKRCG